MRFSQTAIRKWNQTRSTDSSLRNMALTNSQMDCYMQRTIRTRWTGSLMNSNTKTILNSRYIDRLYWDQALSGKAALNLRTRNSWSISVICPGECNYTTMLNPDPKTCPPLLRVADAGALYFVRSDAECQWWRCQHSALRQVMTAD